MWEELNRPRTATERSVAPAGAAQPPPPSSAPLPPPPPPVGSVPAAGPGGANADDEAAPTTAKAEPRVDSQHLLLIGTCLFILIVVVALTVFGGSNGPTTAAVSEPTVTAPDVLPAVDEPTTVTSEAPEATTTTSEPTAMGLPAALLDGPQSQVYRLYQTALGREPDRSGFQYWSDEVRAGTPLETLAQSFLASDEFREQFDPSWSPLQRVELLLTNAFGPPADDAELEAWLKRYRGLEGAALLLAISEADETLAATGTLR